MVNEQIIEALEKIHGINYENFIDLYNIDTNPIHGKIASLHFVKSGLGLGLTKKLANNDLTEPFVVIGAPCICYCQANIKKINFQDVIDLLYPIYTAYQLDCQCVITLQVYEAILQQEVIDGFVSTEEDWRILYKQLLMLTEHITFLFNMPREQVTVVSTLDEDIKELIDGILADPKVSKYLNNEFLYGMYSLNNQSSHPKGSPSEELFLNVYKRNIATYLPITIGKIIGSEFPNLLTVENCTQLKTAAKAELLNQQVFPERESSIVSLPYISTPGLGGREMCQSFERDQVNLDICDEDFVKNFHRVDGYVDYYYRNAFPAEICVPSNHQPDDFLNAFNQIRDVLRSNW